MNKNTGAQLLYLLKGVFTDSVVFGGQNSVMC